MLWSKKVATCGGEAAESCNLRKKGEAITASTLPVYAARARTPALNEHLLRRS